MTKCKMSFHIHNIQCFSLAKSQNLTSSRVVKFISILLKSENQMEPKNYKERSKTKLLTSLV